MRRAAQSISRRVLSQRKFHSKVDPPIQVTTLPNKIRVATESTPGHFSSVGVFVDAGARYETPSTLGASHFIEKLALKSTKARSDEQMTTAIHAIGGQIQCTTSRESIMYQSAHFHDATLQALSIISDTVLNPAFLAEEIEEQKDAAQYELRELQSKPQDLLPEVLHHVAYGGEKLGNPLHCQEDRVDEVNEKVLRGFMKEWYTPERIVIAGSGMPHEELVELTDKYFSAFKSTAASPQLGSNLRTPPPPSPLLTSNSPSVLKSLTRAASYLYPNTSSTATSPINPSSNYKGGHMFVQDNESELNHLYIAFEGVGIHDNDIYSMALLQILLGGGGSFSAGGPGKGMYSRLYTHILNRLPQVDHCESFHHIYTDSSLFGIFTSFYPHHHGLSPAQVTPFIAHEFALLLHQDTQDAELQKAKNQLKSSLMMALESRAVLVEDLGRQVLAHGRKIPLSEMCDQIDQVTASDLRRVAHRIFGPDSGNKATILCMGKEDVGDWRGALAKYSVGGA